MTLEPTLITMLFDFENASDEGRTDMFEEAVGRMIAAENELALLRAELHQRAHDAVGAETELEAANGRLARMREFAKPFADAYEMEKASHLSGIVCVRNMAALTTYGDWKELAAALKETE